MVRSRAQSQGYRGNGIGEQRWSIRQQHQLEFLGDESFKNRAAGS
jgi:hypothetical protein